MYTEIIFGTFTGVIFLMVLVRCTKFFILFNLDEEYYRHKHSTIHDKFV